MFPWYKHPTNSFRSDPRMTLVLLTYGFRGYGMVVALREIVTASMETMESSPYVEYPINKWASELRLKQKKAIEFLSYLNNIGEIKLEQNENIFGLYYPNILQLLSDRAISSAKRSPSGAPREEQKRGEEIKEDENDSIHSHSLSFLEIFQKVGD